MPLNDGMMGDRYDRRQEKAKTIKAGRPGEDEEQLPPPIETIRKEKQEVGRNDPCPCGSGKKYKKCCGK